VTGVAIAVGTASDFDGRPVATTATTCTGSGDLGSIVTVPLSGKDSSMGIKAILGVGRDPVDCAARFDTGCVAARRALNYIPHTRLTLALPMNSSCLGVSCAPDQTCVDGVCTGATISNPGACKSECGEGALTPSGGKPDVPSAAVCGDMSGLQPGAAWPMMGYCPTRLGRSPRIGPQTSVVRWTANIGSPLHGGPSIAADGTVYVGADDGKLYAVSSTGQVLWSSRASGAFGPTQPALGHDGTVYAGSADGNLYAFLAGGGVAWTFAVGGTSVWPSPSITATGTILVGGGTGQSSAFAIAPSGQLAWKVTTQSDVLSAPAIGVDGTIFVGSEDKNLYALNPDGSLKWTYPGNDGLQSPVVGPEGVVYVAGKPSMCAIDATGKLKWITPTDGDATAPAIASDGTVYVAAATGTFYALDGATGTERWRATLTAFDTHLQPLVGADGLVYVGATDGTLYALSPDGTVKWKLTTGSAIGGAAAMGADGALYVGTADGHLIAIGP
jgi:outer membrane protein assembly factor BamB